ncbi:MAG TPA: SMP-30/gluconolactonase/LRE family protein [Polyangiaceae bacterium]|nr:SMP-30/gluconolactonase/LRE family protein [Polyangiaceae bacterium]
MLTRLPGRWRPPAPPAPRGPYEPNLLLRPAELWPTPGGFGPEDVVLDGRGRLYAGLADGRILRWSAPGRDPELVTNTGGRPLGLELDPEGRLVVCDGRRGLLRVDPEASGRAPEVLADRFEGRPLSFTNNAAISRGGTIYFTETSTRHGVDRYRDDLLEHRPYGSLYALDPAAPGGPERLLDGLYFANGVALAPDESFLIVAETSAYRLRRYWLRGERRGTHEVLVDNLPGFPDNLSTGSGGVFWFALPAVRNRALDRLLPHPFARALVAALPEALQPPSERYGLILGVDARGAIVRGLHDPTGRVAEVSGVREHEGWLYFGSVTEPFVGRVRLPHGGETAGGASRP